MIRALLLTLALCLTACGGGTVDDDLAERIPNPPDLCGLDRARCS